MVRGGAPALFAGCSLNAAWPSRQARADCDTEKKIGKSPAAEIQFQMKTRFTQISLSGKSLMIDGLDCEDSEKSPGGMRRCPVAEIGPGRVGLSTMLCRGRIQKLEEAG